MQMVQVTRPIEEAIRLAPGITTVRSVTARGSSEISVFFRTIVRHKASRLLYTYTEVVKR